jgi:hypothetical protein
MVSAPLVRRPALVPGLVPLLLLGCGAAIEPAAFTASVAGLTAPQGQQMQGQQMQGQQMQGQQMQGVSIGGTNGSVEQPVWHRYDGWEVRSARRAELREGQLFAITPDGRRLAGAALIGATLPGDQGGKAAQYRIDEAFADPAFADGSTWLYAVSRVALDGTRNPLCRPDANGVAAAIPIAAVFDERGDRLESATHFTFACTAGALGKCYRWGYRPWLGAGRTFADLHWACTRMARADYCGDGATWTRDGTVINLWDRAPAPGPFNTRGEPPPDFVFEAGWTSRGAACLSKQRWLTLPPDVANRCPDRLIAPGVTTPLATVCDSEAEAALFTGAPLLYDESRLNAP